MSTAPVTPAPRHDFSLSVVIPTFREAHRLPRTLDEIIGYLDHRFREFEVLIVDDNSPDGTGEGVRALSRKHPQVRLLTQPRRLGKGAALRRGCLEARGDYVLFMDADHATPIAEVEAFFPHVLGAVGAVAGVRTYQEGGSRGRRIIGLLCQLLAHLIVFQEAVMDSQCGFKLFTAAAAAKLFPFARVNGGMIDVELFHLMHQLGIECRFVPVNWKNKAGSRINFLICFFNDPVDLVLIRLRDVFGCYREPVRRQPWAAPS